MPSRSILNSTDELDSSMYPSFEIKERQAIPQDTLPQDASFNVCQPSDHMTLERDQMLFQQSSRLMDIRRGRSNSYQAVRCLRAPSRTDSHSPYPIPSQEVNRRRSSTITSGYAMSATPSMTLSPATGFDERGSSQPESSVSMRTQSYSPSVYMASPAVDYKSRAVTLSSDNTASVTLSVPSWSQSCCASAVPSAVSYTLGRMPEPLQHVPLALSSMSSVQSTTTPSTSPESRTIQGTRGYLSPVAHIKQQRRREKRVRRYAPAAAPPPEPTLSIDMTLAPLTKVQKKTNTEIARMFIRNWEMKPKKRRADQDVPVSMEWNPAQQGHKLIDLDLPKFMLLDCIFDPRLLQTEDITNVEVYPDSDPFVELYRICCRVEFMAQVHAHWKDLRSNDDATLSKHLDLLADLKNMGAITPFAPVARYLDAWAEWRTCCELAGSTGRDDDGKHTRPGISKKWLKMMGALGFEERAKQKLKDMLRDKGFVGDWEREVNNELGAVKRQVAAVCKERDGSPFLMDIESLEILKAAHSQ
ncbi:hypothetical protein P171DRAFT_445661 [Karstenula rhodostoma CBS 690.94]|uniref:Uncharacterized protein n=1 Tax=Karstenula rhodostoma CBS 690.94 TaxID=1392251 RepID=A0A9P4U987_9PLEO|nr:hypothetical protein P171DRAFT_445661 [Karstenula rhodostoma CBS 690.94]